MEPDQVLVVGAVMVVLMLGMVLVEILPRWVVLVLEVEEEELER
jgi:uncharacterized protein (DUF983 family)